MERPRTGEVPVGWSRVFIPDVEEIVPKPLFHLGKN
jgi:hypothetical protein